MAAIEKVQSIFNLIGQLSDEEQNALYRMAIETHMTDPFHDITQCELCKHWDSEHSADGKMCCGCGSRYSTGYCCIDYKCMVCSKNFYICNKCAKKHRMIQPIDCESDYFRPCVCNWCAVKCPERIECLYIDEPDHDATLCCKAIENKYFRPSLIKCATKI